MQYIMQGYGQFLFSFWVLGGRVVRMVTRNLPPINRSKRALLCATGFGTNVGEQNETTPRARRLIGPRNMLHGEV